MNGITNAVFYFKIMEVFIKTDVNNIYVNNIDESSKKNSNVNRQNAQQLDYQDPQIYQFLFTLITNSNKSCNFG